ncbi:flagellar biosynthetic protein FliO [Aminobacter sp. MET-1]|uniref:flagellar biosynthetic protein FliO n=1 Tax=Aminobacter sp. MET-1 TaxID=2951085 RepID=UPI00226AA1DE|nr:flagellar biosynthetic protein FliO [Aminobacter sp. MET-1]MCX8568299.1 flagellar biosynthetic protein FliO [Aminobacter sp. MET-1]
MFDWLDSVAGPGYAAAVLWTFAALVLLVIVLVIVKLIRSLTFGTFVAGGRNRKTRLAVMDATAVDSHRRLVLVRRDDVEHLLLIGGPTDVVVETDIRMAAPRRPALTAADNGHEAVPAAQRPAAPSAPQTPRQQPPAPARAQQPAPTQQQAPRPTPVQAVPATPVMPAAASRPAVTPTYVTPARPAPTPPAPQPRRDEIDDTLMKELEVSLDDKPAKKAAAPDLSLDDEMARLLGEFAPKK